MRQYLIALLLPATLAATAAASAQTAEETKPAAEQAAPVAEAVPAEAATAGDAGAAAEGEPAAQAAKPAPKPVATEITARAVEGQWAPEAIRGAPGVSYIGADGEPVISFACLPAEEGLARRMFMRTLAPQGETVEQIALFGGYGNGGAPVSGGSVESGLISAEFEPTSSLGQMLATGQGDLRVRTGNTELLLENSEAVESVVEGCLPSFEENVAAFKAAKAAEAEAKLLSVSADQSADEKTTAITEEGAVAEGI